MDLFFREIGTGDPLFILHGLYGSSDNWLTLGRKFAEKNNVFLVDQRNHGNSPHDDRHDFDLMVADLKELIDKLHKEKVNLLGHSMGGKTVMQFALTYPEMVEHLVVVDISPKSYYDKAENLEQNKMHASIINALCSLELDKITSRDEADLFLSKTVKSKQVRQFLLKNLKRNNQNSFEWKLNIKALQENLSLIFGGFKNIQVPEKSIMGKVKTLFIKGEKSGYMRNSDNDIISQYFPNSRIEVVKDAGHWVHAEQPDTFIRLVDDFLS